jgi:hypothetical protein
MDPFTAIGLVGNVAQFIDFGCKLFSTTHKIYTSQTGLRSDAERIQAVTLDLHGLCLKLKESLLHKATSNDEMKLIALGLQCQRAAEELISALAKLMPKKDQSRWSSLQAALRAVWKQEEIDYMNTQLNGFRMELILRLQIMAS